MGKSMTSDIGKPIHCSSVSIHPHRTSPNTWPLKTSATTVTSSENNFLTKAPKRPQSCRTIPFAMLHPVTVQVLQRVAAESIVDVESYVRDIGDKKYAAVKETRKEQLLRRAKREHGTEELDDATVRKQTNLASAKASRAKKNCILDELHAQLKRKSADSQILANELRRALALVEQLSAAKNLLQTQLHQQKALNFSLLKRTAQRESVDVAGPAGRSSSLERSFVLSSQQSVSNRTTSEQFDHTMFAVDEDMEGAFYMTETDPQVRSQDQLFRNESGQEADVPCARTEETKIELVVSANGSMQISEEIDSLKATDTEGGSPLVSSDIVDAEDLYMCNPSDQFTVAG